MTKTKRRLMMGLALCMSAISVMPLAACGKDELPPEAKNRTVVKYHYGFDGDTKAVYEKAIATYNETQGVTDNVWITGKPYAGKTDNNLESKLANPRRECEYNIIHLNDNQFKDYSTKGYLLSLDSYMTDELKTRLDIENIPESHLNRARLTPELVKTDVNSAGYYLAGKGAQQLGLPVQNDIHILYYNATAMKTAGINIISCEESKLDTEYPKLQPHGYAEYLADASHPAPFEGATASTNEAGDSVYKVFNNRIPMSWEENRLLSRLLINQGGLNPNTGAKYGYCSEWWFYYGFSVGGDCVGWDESKDEYTFTIMDKNPNWLATDTFKINDNTYYAGDVLLHEDATVINTNSAKKAELESKLHRFPSQYDAILEFVRLSQGTGAQSDTDVYGYGIAQDPDEPRTAAFTSGKNTPLLVEGLDQAISFSTTNLDWDMAPVCQWREYKGGSTYMTDGSDSNYAKDAFAKEHLKVIGKEYDGVVYTGELDKAANGTPFVGRATSSGSSITMAVPKNSDKTAYEASVKFMAWMAGPEGQKILMESNAMVPNQPALGMSDEFVNGDNRVCDNQWALSYEFQGIELGDYDYFQSQTWINNWSDVFNKQVRKGTRTLSSFISYVAPGSGGRTIQQIADANLEAMNIYMCGR